MNIAPRLSFLFALGAFAVGCGGGAPPPDAPSEQTPTTSEPAAPAEAAPPTEAAPSEAPPAEAPTPGGDGQPAPSGKRAPCTLGQDQTCNDDPSVSALWGRCTELGVCECKEGFELSPRSARCQPKR